MSTKHIRGAPGKSWCEKDLVMAWVFQDLAHAEGAIAQGSLIKPCKRCLSKARRDRNGARISRTANATPAAMPEVWLKLEA
jgi:hypothetical protein